MYSKFYHKTPKLYTAGFVLPHHVSVKQEYPVPKHLKVYSKTVRIDSALIVCNWHLQQVIYV